jgi:predicted DNA-binding transcriptional regulator YafY
MSKLSQELRVLFYLNDNYKTRRWINVKEIADYLEVSDRQARRYLDDLNLITNIDIESKLGRDGGYRLATPLEYGFSLPENVALALSIAMRTNDSIVKVLTQMTNYVVSSTIVGDNYIDQLTYDTLVTLVKSIKEEREVAFNYREIDAKLSVVPYKIILTNHTYYLYGTYKEKPRLYDVRFIYDLKILNKVTYDNKIYEQLNKKLKNYGIKDGKETILRVKVKDTETLQKFYDYYERKGKMDLVNLTFEVVGNSENELYYPLFRISTKSYKFLDEDFKNNYLNYLKTQISSINEVNNEL